MSSKRSVRRKIQAGAMSVDTVWKDFADTPSEVLVVETASVAPDPAVKVAIEAFRNEYPKNIEAEAASITARKTTRKVAPRKKTTKSKKSS
jgi:hypothetical protein